MSYPPQYLWVIRNQYVVLEIRKRLDRGELPFTFTDYVISPLHVLVYHCQTLDLFAGLGN
jgi:hypothetical protein